jgi:hypothetical protein
MDGCFWSPFRLSANSPSGSDRDIASIGEDSGIQNHRPGWRSGGTKRCTAVGKQARTTVCLESLGRSRTADGLASVALFRFKFKPRSFTCGALRNSIRDLLW